MASILRLTAASSVPQIERLLRHSGARQFVLLCPDETPPAFLVPDAFEQLAAIARAVECVVVVVGGDAHLRARAVLAGCVAATSLDALGDVSEADGPITRPALPTLDGAPRLMALPRASWPGTEPAQRPEQSASWEDHPPAYLCALLDGGRPAVALTPSGAAPPQAPAGQTGSADLDAFDERMASLIRATSQAAPPTTEPERER